MELSVSQSAGLPETASRCFTLESRSAQTEIGKPSDVMVGQGNSIRCTIELLHRGSVREKSSHQRTGIVIKEQIEKHVVQPRKFLPGVGIEQVRLSNAPQNLALPRRRRLQLLENLCWNGRSYENGRQPEREISGRLHLEVLDLAQKQVPINRGSPHKPLNVGMQAKPGRSQV